MNRLEDKKPPGPKKRILNLRPGQALVKGTCLPGTIIKMSSGKVYEIQANGSWKRVRLEQQSA